MNLEGLSEKKNRKGTIYYEDSVGDIVAKVCGKCGEVKELEEYWSQKRGLGGRNSSCKGCRKEWDRAWYENNKERSAENSRIWQQNNKERMAEMGRIWRENNKERAVVNGRAWRENNRDKVAVMRQRRRARKAMLPNTLTSAKYEDTCEYFKGCALTGETDNLELEHAIPIAVGHGGTTEENCYPMRYDLNGSKGNRNIFEWFESNRQRFELSQERFDKLIEWLASANAMTVEEYRDYVYWCHANPRSIDEIKTKTEAI